MIIEKEDFKFEYGGNVKLKKKVAAWEAHQDYKGYCIAAPSGYGKTTLLKELGNKLVGTNYIPGFRVLEDLCEDVRKGITSPVLRIDSDCECIFIDHLDIMRGKQTTTQEIGWMLKRSECMTEDKKRLIICTFIDGEIAEEFSDFMDYELIFIKPVKPNLRIVREKARDFSIKLPKNKVYDYAGLDSMFDLKMAFREIEREEFLKGMSNKLK